MTSVCIIDFAGNNRQPGCWCDYYPEEKITRFGGFWCDVPDLITEREPSEEECEAHAKKYEENCFRGYLNYIGVEQSEIDKRIKSMKEEKKRFYPT